MTIRIGDLPTDIETADLPALRVMTDRVVHDRPSFRSVTGRVGAEPVSIYTARPRGGRERLVVLGAQTRHEIDASQLRTLYQLLADAYAA